MSDDLNHCTTIRAEQADVLRGSTRLVRRDDRKATDETTIHQVDRVPAAKLAALVTTVRVRTRRSDDLVAWAWLLAACGASAALGAVLYAAFA